MTTTIKRSLRQLAKTPGFTIIAIITLAVGIGVNAAVFSLINGWMLRPLPGERDGDLVRLISATKEVDPQYQWFSYPYYSSLRKENGCFNGLAAFSPSGFALRKGDLTRTAIGAYVSSNFFSVFGVTPALGRFFTEDEERPGSHIPVAVISHRFWQSQGANPEIVGRTMTLSNDVAVTIIGVLPKTFVSASQITNKEIWLPLGMVGGFSRAKETGKPPRLNTHRWRGLVVVGQLKPKWSVSSLGPHLDQLAAGLAAMSPSEYHDLGLSTAPLGNIIMSPGPHGELPIKKPLTALIVVSVSILLIACLNLANMFLARGMRRQREIAIRLALGSGRLRIIRQLISEGLLLSLTGGALGLLLAQWSVRIPVRFFERFTGGEGTIPTDLDWRLLIATVCLCALSSLLFCLGPAIRLTQMGFARDLKESQSNVTRVQASWRRVMIAAQVALAFTLVACAGLFVQSACQAAQADPGLVLDRGLLIDVSVREQAPQAFGRILTRLRSMAGIEAASLGHTVPLMEAYSSGLYQRADYNPSDKEPWVEVRVNTIGADYFKALGVPLRHGREFNSAEEQSKQNQPVAIIDTILAESLWPNEEALGRSLQQGDNAQNTFRVVGVVPHLHDSLIEAQPNPHVYLPFGQRSKTSMFIHVRLSDPATPIQMKAMKRGIQEELRAMDSSLAIRGIRTWREHIEVFSQLQTIRLGAGLFGTLGLLALGLAALGLYGVKSYWVSQRTREIGIRMALGATHKTVLSQVLSEGFTLALIGLGVGLLLTWICSRFLASLLFDISGTEPFILIATVVVLAATLLLASLIPAWRAARVDPMEALRYE